MSLLTADFDFSSDPTVEGMRALVDRVQSLNGPGPDMTCVSDHAVPGLAAEVRVRLLQPVPEPRGVLIFLGVGGWVAGHLDAWECLARKLAERTSCTLALIDFRRLPEHPYPAAADDVHGAARWLWQERVALGHNGLPHMIVGEGMGAALAAVTADRATRDPDGPRLALQFLICPVGDGLADLPAQDGPGLPPTVVVTAELDPARAAGAALVERLRVAGVPVAHRDFARQGHGFFGVLVLPLGERVFQHIVRAVRGYVVRFCAEDVPQPGDLSAWLNRIIK